MQLSDAEIRDILIRRRREKIRRQKRRRRRMLIVLLLFIVLIFVLIRVIDHQNKNGGKSKGSAGSAGNLGIIFIDPGHGGMDPGSDDGDDRIEKDDNLKLGLAVRDHLQKLGFTVEMSRTEDETVDRAERGKMANKAGAMFFVSLHRNQADGSGHGVEGFIPKQDDSESRLLGENIMHFLARAGFDERTIRAGTLVDPNNDYEENAVSEMPSVLIEVGFLSNADDNYLFDHNLDRNARAIADAVNYTYLQLNEPDEAAKYRTMIEQTDAACETAISSTIEAVNVLSEVNFITEGESDEGIDPEA